MLVLGIIALWNWKFLCILCNPKTLRYFHEHLHQCNNMQSARTVTLQCVFLEWWSFEIESRFLIVSALYLKKSFEMFSWNFTKIKVTWDDLHSAWPITLDCMFLELWPFEIEKSFCWLSYSKTIWDIFKHHTNVKYHETTCSAQEPSLWITYFWIYGPLKIDNSVFCDKIVAAPYFIWLNLKKRSWWIKSCNEKTYLCHVWTTRAKTSICSQTVRSEPLFYSAYIV